MTAAIVWFTGLPASGKSTLAERTRSHLAARGHPAIVLDGDAVRDVLGAHAYTAAQRDELYRVVADLAVLLAGQDVTVLVAATAPRRVHRERVRRSPGPVFEVWVRASVADCEARDVKGLYARAHAGEIDSLPGVGVPFEAPDAPAVIAEGGMDPVAVPAIAALVDGTASAPRRA